MTTMAASSWIARPRPNPRTRLRLLCFPYAGGGASIFRTWSDDLPRDVEVCPVQLPGRESRMRELPFTRLPPLVQALAQALLPYLDIPFAFFGHSMGALISFELARQLRRQYGLSPAHLFVSSHRAPQIPDPHPPIHHLPESMFVEELRRFSGTPELILQNPEIMEVFLPLLRADFSICETYTYSPEDPLECPISAFGGLHDLLASRDDLESWRDQTLGSFTLRMFPGDHFFLHTARAPLLQTVSQGLTQLLSRIAGGQCP